jgi:hypothetical protein
MGEASNTLELIIGGAAIAAGAVVLFKYGINDIREVVDRFQSGDYYGAALYSVRPLFSLAMMEEGECLAMRGYGRIPRRVRKWLDG